MGVGDEDMRDGLARECLLQRSDMLGQIGTGVDHRDLAVPDDIGAGALEGEGARITCQHAADQR